jgi:uncharacterized protein (DUF1778 family)
VAEVIMDGGEAALDALADRRVFQLDDAQWDALIAALDAPTCENPALPALLARKPAWERCCAEAGSGDTPDRN